MPMPTNERIYQNAETMQNKLHKHKYIRIQCFVLFQNLFRFWFYSVSWKKFETKKNSLLRKERAQNSVSRFNTINLQKIIAWKDEVWKGKKRKRNEQINEIVQGDIKWQTQTQKYEIHWNTQSQQPRQESRMIATNFLSKFVFNLNRKKNCTRYRRMTQHNTQVSIRQNISHRIWYSAHCTIQSRHKISNHLNSIGLRF